VRARYPDERIYTFWDYFRQHWQKNSGLRIDHLLLNAELAPRLRSAGVDRWVRDFTESPRMTFLESMRSLFSTVKAGPPVIPSPQLYGSRLKICEACPKREAAGG
jgi:hypothetical protein